MTKIFRSTRAAIALIGLTMLGSVANAGVDLYGIVSGAQVRPDGSLWFTITPVAGTSSPSTYCQPGWAGFGMYVPATNPQFAYYYGVVMMSLTKNRNIDIPNISVYNGTTSCDITTTGFGLAIF